MIFKQYQQVLDGTKTQTRRLHWPKHLAPGKTRAAVPGRGKRWADEPQVCVIDFRRTDELVAMLDRMEVA